MIEEPYRWVEAIANRREYIEMQLASGSPIVALGYRDGILFLTFGQRRQKLFEIYDRIAMGAIGHPGDIERLRMAVIELASTEGFTRSAADVSLRRLAYYSLSPVMKGAFEQVYGAPYLARLVFAEVGAKPEEDLFLRLEYDGAISTSALSQSVTRDRFAVISGTRDSTAALEDQLRTQHKTGATLRRSLALALDGLLGAQLRTANANGSDPTRERLVAARAEQMETGGIEAAILERESRHAIRYRPLPVEEINSALSG